MKRKFLINPAAGGGIPAKALNEMKEFFQREDGEFHPVLCGSRREMIEETGEALKKGFGQIVAVGGDGSVNAVANGFFDAGGSALNPEACLAVAPLGSGSDYFRTLRGGSGAGWREIVTKGRIVEADVGFLDTGKNRGYFVNMAGLGVSAEIVKIKEKLPSWVPRSLCYAVPTIYQAPKIRPFPAKLLLDGKPVEEKLLAAFLAKGTYAGGGMRLGGRASLDDGCFDLTLIHAMPLGEIVKNLPRLFLGDIDQVKGIEKIKVKKVEILGPKAVPIEIDGELAGTSPAAFSVIPKAIRVCTA